jgi:hypothetical protein
VISSRLTRRVALPVATLVALLGVFAFLSVPAFAASTHAFSTSFGSASSIPVNPYPLSGPTSVAVDETSPSHDIYVTDPTNVWVEKFDSSGNLILIFGKGVNKTKVEEAGSTEVEQNLCVMASGNTCQAGTPGTTPGAFTTPRFIAVDNSGGASAGDVYVADTGTNLVQKFDSAGNLISAWGNGGQLSGSFGSLAGIAVDTAGALGNLWVYDTNANMFEFGQDGSFTTSWNSGRGVTAAGISVDSITHLYVLNGGASVTAFTSAGTQIGDLQNDFGGNTGLAVDPSTNANDLYVDGGNVIRHYGSSCDPSVGCNASDSFGGAGELSAAAGLAVDSVTHNVYAADPGNSRISVFVPVALPTVTTGAVSNRQRTTATVNGHVDPAGGGPIIECAFQYVADAAFKATGFSDLSSGGTRGCEEGNSFTAPADVHAELTGLSPLTTYHYRLLAANANGSSQGEGQSFTTPALPAIEGQPVANLTSTTATLRAQINPNTAETNYHFEYGTSTSYGTHTADAGPLTGATDQPVSAGISGLQANTLYHYRVVAHNSVGTTEEVDHTFTTLPNVPSATTDPASAVGQRAATLNGTIDPQGAETSYYFEYSGPGTFSIVTGKAGSGSGATTVTAPVNGLSPGATYQYRLIATNAGGTTVGSYQTFTTAPPPSGPPAVVTGGTSNLTPTTVTLTGTVDPKGGATSYQFQYGTSAAYGASLSEASAGSGAEPGGVAAGLSGLAVGTTYHYRLLATNVAGTSYGTDQTFSTPAAPVSVFGPAPTNTLALTTTTKPTTSKPLTRAQKLAKALKACKKDKSKAKRAKCAKEARKKYAPPKKKKKKK